MNLFWRQYWYQKAHIEDAPNIFWSPWKGVFSGAPQAPLTKIGFSWWTIRFLKKSLKSLYTIKMDVKSSLGCRSSVWNRFRMYRTILEEFYEKWKRGMMPKRSYRLCWFSHRLIKLEILFLINFVVAIFFLQHTSLKSSISTSKGDRRRRPRLSFCF